MLDTLSVLSVRPDETGDDATTPEEDWEDLPDEIVEAELQEERQFRLQVRHKGRRHDTGSEKVLERLLADSDGLSDLIATYKPTRHEKVWLLSSLRDFYEQGMITDVLASVKGGKEASVYRCRASRNIQEIVQSEFIAAKVYRPRIVRNLRNDAQYRAGRTVLTSEGKAVKNSDTRLMKALGKKTAFGKQVQHTSWLMYEFTTLQALHQAGAAVPRPIAASENALLMEYIGDENRAAPTLIETSLNQDEAQKLFLEVKRNISLLLSLGWIHGDLSAYNILYYNGKITLIDFPQVISREGNPDAEELFYRDITRVCDYFNAMGVKTTADRLAAELWRR